MSKEALSGLSKEACLKYAYVALPGSLSWEVLSSQVSTGMAVDMIVANGREVWQLGDLTNVSNQTWFGMAELLVRSNFSEINSAFRQHMRESGWNESTITTFGEINEEDVGTLARQALALSVIQLKNDRPNQFTYGNSPYQEAVHDLGVRLFLGALNLDPINRPDEYIGAVEKGIGAFDTRAVMLATLSYRELGGTGKIPAGFGDLHLATTVDND